MDEVEEDDASVALPGINRELNEDEVVEWSEAIGGAVVSAVRDFFDVSALVVAPLGALFLTAAFFAARASRNAFLLATALS